MSRDTVTTTGDVWTTYVALAEARRTGASRDCVRVERERDGTITLIEHYGIGLTVRAN